MAASKEQKSERNVSEDIRRKFAEKGEKIGIDIAGWYKPEITEDIAGRIMGLQVIRDARGKRRNVYLVQLAHDALAVGKGFKMKTGESISEAKKRALPLTKGQIIGVAERKKLEDMRNYVTHRGEVLIIPKEKIEIGDREMWLFDCTCIGQKAPINVALADDAARDDEETAEGDDIPF